jgi:hypothetical protein
MDLEVSLVSVPALTAGPAPDIVTVYLSNFAFTPDQLRLRAGEPVRLRIVNDGIVTLIPNGDMAPEGGCTVDHAGC